MKKQNENLKNLALLRKIPLFSGLAEQNLRYIAGISIRKTYKEGDIIFTKNTFGKTIYIVVSGRIKIFTEYSSGRKKTLVYLDSGEFFGELAVLCKPLRSASAQVLNDCELLVIQQKDFLEILKAYPNVSLNLITALCNRLREADKEIESLSFYSILGRIARILLNLEKRYGKSTPQGRMLNLPLEKRDIAELAGTVREVATRALTKLVKVGCIKYAGKHMIITDINRLLAITNYR